MEYDSASPAVALCAAGVEVEGDPGRARALFERAWAARADDFDASVAAHFLARHQPTPAETLRWNEVALRHADALPGHRARDLLPSLCLNLADSYLMAGRLAEARGLADRASAAVDALPGGGYAGFVRAGIDRLHQRILAAGVDAPGLESHSGNAAGKSAPNSKASGGFTSE
jgi:hypothetical protein